MGDFVGIRTQIKSAADPLRLYNVMTDPHEDHDLAADPAFADTLKRVRDEMSSVHRPDPDAPRPYDNEPLPAVSARVTAGKVQAEAFEGKWPWVPDFDALTAARTTLTAGLDLSARTRDENFGIKFSGCIQVPATGEYTFYLSSDSGAQFWINDAHVIGDDFNRSGAEISSRVTLAAGLHPFHLFYRHGAGPMQLELLYAGPGLDKQAIPISSFAAPQ